MSANSNIPNANSNLSPNYYAVPQGYSPQGYLMNYSPYPPGYLSTYSNEPINPPNHPGNSYHLPNGAKPPFPPQQFQAMTSYGPSNEFRLADKVVVNSNTTPKILLRSNQPQQVNLEVNVNRRNEEELRAIIEAAKGQFDQGLFEKVIADLNKALQRPTSCDAALAELYFLLGHAYLRVNQLEYGMNSWKLGLTFKNADTVTQEKLNGALGDAHYNLQLNETAYSYYRSITKLEFATHDSMAHSFLRMAIICSQRKDFERTFAYLQKGAECSDASPEIQSDIYKSLVSLITHFHSQEEHTKAKQACVCASKLNVSGERKAQMVLLYLKINSEGQVHSLNHALTFDCSESTKAKITALTLQMESIVAQIDLLHALHE